MNISFIKFSVKHILFHIKFLIVCILYYMVSLHIVTILYKTYKQVVLFKKNDFLRKERIFSYMEYNKFLKKSIEYENSENIWNAILNLTYLFILFITVYGHFFE